MGPMNTTWESLLFLRSQNASKRSQGDLVLDISTMGVLLATISVKALMSSAGWNFSHFDVSISACEYGQV